MLMLSQHFLCIADRLAESAAASAHKAENQRSQS
jgi:hypothetical protein